MTQNKEQQQSDNPSKSSSKSWKEYFLDFFMLFLAVSLGFMADNIRENISDNAKEKEYITSMIEDAEKDKVNIKFAIASNNLRIRHLDSLSNLCIHYDANSPQDVEMYRHYIYGLKHPDFVMPTERTIQQLKKAGGMRLLRNKNAVDLIIIYDNNSKKLPNQQHYYQHYQNLAIDKGMQLFNFQKFGLSNFSVNFKRGDNPQTYYKLINNDPTKLMEFGNVILIYLGVARYYSTILQEMDVQADELIETLQNEYQL